MDWRNSVVIGTYCIHIIEKTIIVVFNKLTCTVALNFLHTISLLEQVKEYKYLGIMLLDRSLFKQTPKLLGVPATVCL